MKYSDMNDRQKKAFINIKYAAHWLIGGYENTVQDFPEDSEEYQKAKAFLEDHDNLVLEVYNMAIHNIYLEGAEFYNTDWIRDIRFCGKDWLMERCERRITKEGY